ncbi:MAG TPA: DUF1553 domain-containing protein, partial [Planctomycetia bacterium]|nr:DUF1553 domain-containing protein [Planctomycetia bacterium]
EDVIDTTGKAFLGLTIGCARCHSHKHDPISAADYYALYGIFASTKFPYPGCEKQQRPRDMATLPMDPAARRRREEWQKETAAVESALKALADEAKPAIAALAEAAKKATDLAAAKTPDGGSASLPENKLRSVAVKRGDLLLLAINPNGNHGADSTLVEWELAQLGGALRKWSLQEDCAADLTAGNPHADRGGDKPWHFFDLRGGPQLLPDRKRGLDGKPGLDVWRQGELPSVFANATKSPLQVWTTLPARSVFVHPAPDGAVGVGWLSPIDGVVKITGRVADAHPGGDGVGWRLSHVAGAGASLAAMAKSRERAEPLERRLAERRSAEPRAELAYAVQEGTPKDVKIHERGDPEKPGSTAPRRWLEIFGGEKVRSGSGRRQLADWIARADNPLFARVIVNRVWQHHFGVGIVGTANDFGTHGMAPTHPELLDHLAKKLIRGGWRLKSLHRAIMLTAAYRRASAGGDPGPSALPLARFERRRLDAEEIRDSLLAVTGDLDRSAGAAFPFPPESTWSFTQHAPFAAEYPSDRRSVYLISVRNRR